MWPASHSRSTRTSTSCAPSSSIAFASSRETTLPVSSEVPSGVPSVNVGALDQERHPHMGAVLVQVLAADTGRDDVDRADVAQSALRLGKRLPGGVIGRRLRASDQLDDLHHCHRIPPSRSLMVTLRAPTPSSSAARVHGSTVSSAGGSGVVSARNRSTAATIAAASSALALRFMGKA